MFKKNKFMMVVFLLTGLIIGSYLSVLLDAILPYSTVKDVFTLALHPSFGTFTIDLIAIKITFGLSFNFTLCSIIGLAIAAYIYRWY